MPETKLTILPADTEPPELTVSQVREVWRKIATKERKHGHFLTAFGNALIHADDENELLMQPVARELIRKYGLEKYADSQNGAASHVCKDRC
jgi:hypothetical protein